MEDMNLALVSKLAWQILNGDSCPWVQLLKGRYIREGDTRQAVQGRNPSWIWKSICSLMHLLKSGSCNLIGDGLQIGVWSDAWIPSMPLFLPEPKHFSIIEHHRGIKVVDLILPMPQSWELAKAPEIYSVDTFEAVKKIALPG